MNIEKVQQKDIRNILKVSCTIFKKNISSSALIKWLINNVDWTISYVAKDKDKVIGFYLLREMLVPNLNEETAKYQNLKGIEGVALGALPEYRGKGLGRTLRALPLSMPYDYIWGYQRKNLSNIDNWTSFGRKIVFEDKHDYITLMELNHRITEAKVLINMLESYSNKKVLLEDDEDMFQPRKIEGREEQRKKNDKVRFDELMKTYPKFLKYLQNYFNPIPIIEENSIYSGIEDGLVKFAYSEQARRLYIFKYNGFSTSYIIQHCADIKKYDIKFGIAYFFQQKTNFKVDKVDLLITSILTKK